MSAGAPLTVVFRVAAGPRVGFGHLVRCRALARALGVTPLVAIRGTARTRALAAALGWTVLDSERPSLTGGPADGRAPDLIVIDDPDGPAAASWVRRGRRLGVPVASVHDLGLAHVESDLMIDGSVSPGPRADQPNSLCGPRYAILDPAIAVIRRENRQPMPGHVLVALGGGSHVLSLAGRVSRAIAARAPEAVIRVARGLSSVRAAPVLRHATWFNAPQGLGPELADAQVAVVAGGVTLYEACALGVPVVALPVTTVQHQTVRAAACRGAAIDTGRPPVDDCMVSRTAEAVAALLRNDGWRRQQSKAARQLVDGDGAARVAVRLRELVARSPAKAGRPRSSDAA